MFRSILSAHRVWRGFLLDTIGVKSGANEYETAGITVDCISGPLTPCRLFVFRPSSLTGAPEPAVLGKVQGPIFTELRKRFRACERFERIV